MSRVAWIPAALFVIAVPLFLVTASVTWAFNNPGVYERGFEKYRVSSLTGITRADLLRVAADIRHYFNSGEEPRAGARERSAPAADAASRARGRTSRT